MAARRWRSGFRLPPPCGSPDCRPLRMTPDRKPGGPSAPDPLRSHPSTDAAILAPGVAEPGGPPARTRAGHVPVQRAGSPRLARSRRVLQGSGARARSPGTRRPPSPPARRTRTVPGGSAARAAGRHPARSGRRLRQAPCTVVPSPAWRRGPALLAGTPAKPRLRATPLTPRKARLRYDRNRGGCVPVRRAYRRGRRPQRADCKRAWPQGPIGATRCGRSAGPPRRPRCACAPQVGRKESLSRAGDGTRHGFRPEPAARRRQNTDSAARSAPPWHPPPRCPPPRPGRPARAPPRRRALHRPGPDTARSLRPC